MKRARVPGLTRAAVSGGVVGPVEILGLAHGELGEPVTETTLFEAASLSKPVFAMIVLRLAERGEFDLDRPLHELLPYQRISHDPRSERLTARLVLSHQTGLPNWGPEKLSFNFAPGESFGYSGEGYVYLQRVVEHVTGQTLEMLARREVFEPLGMVHSHFVLAEDVAVAGSGSEASAPDTEQAALVLAAPHDQAGRPRPKNLPEEANAAASLHTTAADYARFVAAWMGAKAATPLLQNETLDMALSSAVQLQPEEEDSLERRAVAERLGWALGWGLFSPAAGAGPIAFHWGDNGDFKAFVAFDREAGSGVVYFANASNGLAIGDALTLQVSDDMGPLLRWLGYPQHDDPGWTQALEGLIAEGDARYRDAVVAFRAALAVDPANEEMERRIAWLEELLEVHEKPVTVAREVLAGYVGQYGPRTLRLDGEELRYRREGRPAFRLIPLTATLFALDGMVEFRLEVVVDEAGEPVKLVGHYLEGSTDENPRTGALPTQ